MKTRHCYFCGRADKPLVPWWRPTDDKKLYACRSGCEGINNPPLRKSAHSGEKAMRKMCWLAKEYRKGWKLGIADNSHTFFIPKFFSMEQIKNLRKRKLLVTLPLVEDKK